MLSQYYQTNNLYKYITENDIENFKFSSGNLWQLVYGDSNAQPKLLVVLSGVDTSQIDCEVLYPEEEEAYNLLNHISEKSNIPLRFIRFSINAEDINEVWTFKKGESEQQILSLDQLRDAFSHEGLSVSKSKTRKYLNDATSSAYHKWQRAELGSDIKVSDFDLWRMNNEGEPIEVFELKRSIISIENWQPYKEDYTNFHLLYNTLQLANVQLKIVYNVRKKNPFSDDISKLKVFEVNFNEEPAIEFNKILELNEFFK